MSINKVIYGDSTLIDLTSDLVTASALMSGITAHDSSGALITGTIAAKTSADITVAGPTVTVPGGVYSGSNSVTIPSADLYGGMIINPEPDITVSSTGLITAAVDTQSTEEMIRLRPGYVSSVPMFFRAQGSSTYQLPTKSSNDITVAGSTVTVPSGYYAGAVNKSVARGSLNEYINVPSITPVWSIDSSTGEVSAESMVALGVQPIATSGYFENDVYVYPIITLDSSYQLSTKSAATYTPSTTAQTIASGQYLTGAQTISGDTNLIPSNIASGVSIFGVTGTHTGGVDTSNDTVTESALLSGYTAHDSTGTQITGSLEFVNYYTGSSAPSSSLGADDDLYLQTGSIAHVSNTTLVIDSLVTGNILVL